MISFTTRNRPHVLEYSLKKTREHYDGTIVVIDDNSDTIEANQFVCDKYNADHIYNHARRGIPGSKARAFRILGSFDYQYWFDDDCYPKPGWLEKIQEAQEIQPHLLYLKDWAHVKEIGRDCGIVEYSGATACFMSFTREIYPKVKGFYVGHGLYGGWHHQLSLKLGGYYSIENVSDYLYSFDIDHAPADYNYSFGSSLPQHERIKR